jgi:signal transduction histidine kinase
VFPGENEIARRLRDLDWSSNELGVPDTWPQNLQTAVVICLASRMPMQVWWGAQRTLIYNAASIELMAPQHPSALARSGVGAFGDDVWATIGPQIDRAFHTGETTWCEAVRMLLPRQVASQETYVTFSFSPITDDTGRVEGVIGSCVDVTESVLGARRMSLLHKLGVASASVHSFEGAAKLLASVFGDGAAVPYMVLLRVEDQTPRAVGWFGAGEDVVGALGESGLSRVVEAEEPIEVAVAGAPALALPVRRGHGVAGVLVCGTNPHLPLDASYRSFLELVAAHVGAAISELGESGQRHMPVAPPAPQLHPSDAFLSIVAHELRNPMSALMTTLQALMLRTPSPEVELMERSVRQLSRIVDNLLDVSRIARGRLELRPKPSELANIVDRAMEIATPLFDERRNQVFVRVPRVGMRLEVDPERVAQAIANLLSNAARYSEPSSRIWIQATREYDRVRVLIKDEGAGIEPERLPLIFQTFYEAPEVRPRTAGLGLGLAIARSLIELHGGTLQVSSAGAGQGTECAIELPLEPRVTVPAPAMPAQASRRRLLLVEDNDDSARALKNALEQLGYVVALAHNGPIALNVARTFDPDVVLMDIGLPVMDGWEVAKRLRELRGVYPAPVVAVTGYDRDADKQRSAEAGFVEHLVKPIDLAKLQQVVESLPLRGS